jgi:hypothetical protein
MGWLRLNSEMVFADPSGCRSIDCQTLFLSHLPTHFLPPHRWFIMSLFSLQHGHMPRLAIDSPASHCRNAGIAHRRRLNTWVILPLVACLIVLALPAELRAQGGGNANAVGTSIQNTLNGQAAGASGSPGSSSDGGAIAPVAAPDASGATPTSPVGPPSSSTPMSSSYSPATMSPVSSPDGSSSSYGSSSGGYDGMSAYGSGQSSGTAVQRGQIAMSAAITNVARSLATFFAPAGGEKPLVSSKLSLWEEAALAFFNGDQRRALALYHAHVVADGESAQKSRRSVTYSRLLKRPVWAVRFGLSIQTRVPESLAGNLQPIREGMQLTGVVVRNAAAGGAPGAAGGAIQPSPENVPVRNEQMMRSDGSSSTDGNFGGFGTTEPARVVTTLGGAATEEARIEVEANLGIVADIVKAMFDSRSKSGKFGRAFDEMEEAGATLARNQSAAGVTSNGLPMWTPGMDYLGIGPAAEMLETAKKNDIDVLLHFDVIVKENKVSSPPYTTRARLILVSTGETLGVSKAIDKFEVAGRRLTVRDAVSEQLVNLFEIIDKRCTVEPMPALQTTHAIARVDSLLGGKSTGSISSLAEIATFHSQKLLDTKQLDQAVYFAAGEEGLRLLHDEELSRYEAAKTMIDRELAGKVEE